MPKANSKIFFLLFISIFNTACGQNNIENQSWLKNFNSAAQNTIVFNNQTQILPLQNLDNLKIISVDFGNPYKNVFDSLLQKYTSVKTINGNQYIASKFFNSLLSNLQGYNTVIVSLNNTSVLNPETLKFILELEKKKQLIIAISGEDKHLANLDEFQSPIVYCNQQTPESAAYTAQIIFGGTGTTARLGKSISTKFVAGLGTNIQKTRLTFTVAEDVGINTSDLEKIDKIIAEGIRARAMPGSVVFVAQNGKVIYNKAYGYHTYQNQTPENVNDIFDLASISKLATTSAAMLLYETGKLNLDTVISAYLPETINTNKQNLKVRELLLHQAGLIPYIPFFEKLKIGDYSRKPSDYFNVHVADSFYIAQDYYKKTMWPIMLNSPIQNRGKYLYSDLSMYFLKEIIENITHEPLENFVQQQFFKPLGMYTTGYHPRQIFDKDQIVPTEKDIYFRKTLLWGFVHDQGAAMVGGVAGHAGLFSNATNLATLFQMLLNKGLYGGQQFLKPQTVALFTAKQSKVSRRGLGFDRWDPDASKQYPSKYSSNQTFGHTGYTGTCVWVDAKHNLVYIFLSNRVHPQVNNKLSELKIRTRILDVIYEAINKAN